MNLDQKLDGVLGRYRELSDQVSSHPSPGSAEYTGMLKEYADITPLVERISKLREAQDEIGDLAGLIADAATDAGGLADTLGIGEMKTSDPKSNPLESNPNLDKLLDGVD